MIDLNDKYLNKKSKTAIVMPTSQITNKGDQYDSFRGEGRAAVNIGFGLSLLGYDVDIVSAWKDKDAWPNVHLRNNPRDIYYDIAFAFTGSNRYNDIRFKKGVFMTYTPEDIERAEKFIRDTGIELKFVCPYKDVIDDVQQNTSYKMNYLPFLFPIPSTNVGFLPFNDFDYDPTKGLNIYMHYNSWDSVHSDFFSKRKLVVDFLKNRYKFNLWIHERNEDMAKNSTAKNLITEYETYYIHNDKMHYGDIINLIKSVDLCITQGGLNELGGSIIDIISLGKPIIYIANGLPKKALNPLYNCPEHLVFVQEKEEESLKKLENIINNRKESFDCFRNAIKDFDFDNWKEYAKDIFDN